jgi:phage shock protein A
MTQKKAIKVDLALVPELESLVKENVSANEYGDLKAKLDQAITQARKSIAGINTHSGALEKVSSQIKKNLDSIDVDYKSVPALALAEKAIAQNKSFVKIIDSIVGAIKSKGY